jgi:hypothetical protein
MITLLNLIWVFNFISSLAITILSYQSGSSTSELLAWSCASIYSFVIVLYDFRHMMQNKEKEVKEDIIDNL